MKSKRASLDTPTSTQEIGFLRTLAFLTIICLILPLTASADILVRAGYLGQQVSTESGYGKFLSDRFGAETLQLAGPFVEVLYTVFAGLAVGLEHDRLSHTIQFKDLNGTSDTGTLEYQQNLLTFHYFIPLGFDFSVGLGPSQLKRTLPGYGVEGINASNFEANSGDAEVETEADTAVLQVIYRILDTMFGIEVGLRFTQSFHEIPVDDKRPALNSKGLPKETDFEISGFGALGSLSITF